MKYLFEINLSILYFRVNQKNITICGIREVVTMSKVYRIGIIGCGGIATGKHMPALKNQPMRKWWPSAILWKKERKTRLRSLGRKTPKYIRTIVSCLRIVPLISYMCVRLMILMRIFPSRPWRPASMSCARSRWPKPLPTPDAWLKLQSARAKN